MEYKDYIHELFNKYKCKNKFDELKCIPVYNEDNTLCAFMIPITYDYPKIMPELILYLNKWRKDNPSISTGVFEITEERTRDWLKNLVLDRWDRLLFIIKGLDGSYIGHLGFSSFSENKKLAEVDAVLKGDKNALPGIMTFAMKSLINFGVNTLKLDTIALEVFSDNEKAIEFYKRTGFEIKKYIPLYEVKLENETKLEIVPEGYDGEIAKYYTLMELNKSTHNLYKNNS